MAMFFLGAVVGAWVGASVGASVGGSVTTILGVSLVASSEGCVSEFWEEGNSEQPLSMATTSARTSARLRKRPGDFFLLKG